MGSSSLGQPVSLALIEDTDVVVEGVRAWLCTWRSIRAAGSRGTMVVPALDNSTEGRRDGRPDRYQASRQ